MKFLDKIEEVLRGVETSKIPFVYFILTFFFATTLRNFLEIFSSSGTIAFNLRGFLFNAVLHFDISYVCLALSLIVLFYLATKERPEKISRVILPSFLILILAPILDLIISLGAGYKISYMFPGQHENLLLRFFTFFGPLDAFGVTPGMRIEIALVLLGSFIYFFIKKRSIIRSLFFSFLTYSLIFIYCAIPFVDKAIFNALGMIHTRSFTSLNNLFLLLIFILGAWLFYLHNKKYLIEILKDARPLRLLHFELMLVLGVALALLSARPTPLMQNTFFNPVFIVIAIVFAWLFSVVTNNLADYDIDRITNRTRPSVSRAIPTEHYKQISWIFFLLAIVYSLAVSFEALFLILLFIGNYFLYSMPPFRLKRVPLFSKLLISLNSLALVMLGYILIAGGLEIPISIIAFFLIFFTAVINFIDIKDYKGDKKAGIRTLPTILGLRKSKIIIGLFFLITYPVVYFLLQNVYLLPFLIGFGVIEFLLINRKKYDEKPVFVVYLFSMVLLILYIIMYGVSI